MKSKSTQKITRGLLLGISVTGLLAACGGGSESPASSADQSKLLISSSSVKIIVPAANVTASSTDAANVPANAVDNNLGTHWTGAALSGTQWIQFNLGGCYTTDFTNISWYQGDARQYNFTIQASADGGSTWTTVKTATSAGTSAGLVQTDFPNTAANVMRLSSTGNSVNNKVSINEVEFWGSAGATCSGTTTTTAATTTTTTAATTTTTQASTSSTTATSTTTTTKASTSSTAATTTTTKTTTTTTSGGTSHDANFSPATLAFLKTNTGLDGEQWDNIMKLVNKPEQDTLDWVKSYSYCENINDGRGFTMGLVGATTGGSNDGAPDGPALFQIFDGLKGATSPTTVGGLKRLGITGTMNGAILTISSADASGNMSSKFCTALHNLQNDAEWRAAIWQSAYNSYISVAVRNAKSRGYTSAATIGSFFDTALNQGGEGDPNSLQGLLDQLGTAADETSFMLKFHNKRLTVVNTNQYNQSPNGTNRVKEWMQLFTDGFTSLKNADAEVVKVTGWTMK